MIYARDNNVASLPCSIKICTIHDYKVYRPKKIAYWCESQINSKEKIHECRKKIQFDFSKIHEF